MTIVRWKNLPAYDMLDKMMAREMNSGTQRNYRMLPATNILEKEDAFVIELAAPGRKKEDFKLQVDNRVLSVSLEEKEEQKEQQERFTLKEFHLEPFSRSFSLPKQTDGENIKASYQNGVLSITIPMKKEEKPPVKQIEIA
ncbi:MAG: Hsp20/alpha crystallin family protein [Bacteroidales bacterium]